MRDTDLWREHVADRCEDCGAPLKVLEGPICDGCLTQVTRIPVLRRQEIFAAAYDRICVPREKVTISMELGSEHPYRRRSWTSRVLDALRSTLKGPREKLTVNLRTMAVTVYQRPKA